MTMTNLTLSCTRCKTPGLRGDHRDEGLLVPDGGGDLICNTCGTLLDARGVDSLGDLDDSSSTVTYHVHDDGNDSFEVEAADLDAALEIAKNTYRHNLNVNCIAKGYERPRVYSYRLTVSGPDGERDVRGLHTVLAGDDVCEAGV